MIYGDSRLPDSFWDKVFPDPNTGCWLWAGAIAATGYGVYKGYAGQRRPHRITLWLETGLLGADARHGCQQRSCLNPDHLSWGSRSDNLRDSVRDGTHVWANKTHCPSGHEYNEENTRMYGGRRYCKPCNRIQVSKYYFRNKVAK